MFAAFAVLIFAKDNYIFDYSSEALVSERFERLEREIAELKGDLIRLKSDRDAPAKRDEDADRLKKLEADVARLAKENAALLAAQKKIAGSIPKNAGVVQTIVERPSADVDERLDKLEAAIAARLNVVETNGADEATALRVNTLADRVFALETSVKEALSRVDSGAGLPFDRYLDITKAHVEYFILGLLAFIVLMFLLLLIALGRASRAESKIAQLVKLYQSSSRKSEDRK